MALYSDVNMFAPQTTFKLEDVAAVYQSIHNILATSPGERFFNPEFGADVDRFVFEPIDNITAQDIKTAFVDAIDRWEPRVSIDFAQSEVVPNIEENKYDVTLSFNILGFDDQIYEFQGTVER